MKPAGIDGPVRGACWQKGRDVDRRRTFHVVHSLMSAINNRSNNSANHYDNICRVSLTWKSGNDKRAGWLNAFYLLFSIELFICRHGKFAWNYFKISSNNIYPAGFGERSAHFCFRHRKYNECLSFRGNQYFSRISTRYIKNWCRVPAVFIKLTLGVGFVHKN